MHKLPTVSEVAAELTNIDANYATTSDGMGGLRFLRAYGSPTNATCRPVVRLRKNPLFGIFKCK